MEALLKSHLSDIEADNGMDLMVSLADIGLSVFYIQDTIKLAINSKYIGNWLSQ